MSLAEYCVKNCACAYENGLCSLTLSELMAGSMIIKLENPCVYQGKQVPVEGVRTQFAYECRYFSLPCINVSKGRLEKKVE